MTSSFHRNLAFETIEEVSRLTSLSQVGATLQRTLGNLGFTSLGLNALPPPREGADPIILTESTPRGFRESYIEEQFYLIDHICARARTAHEPFRYSEAPHGRAEAHKHARFMQFLNTFGMGRGLIVPLGRPANMPACTWLAGENPDLDDGAKWTTQLITLFAASKAQALFHPSPVNALADNLTQREREVLQWISAGKTSWEIGAISGLSERAINKVLSDAMIKLNAVTRTQAVVNAIRLGEIEL